MPRLRSVSNIYIYIYMCRYTCYTYIYIYIYHIYIYVCDLHAMGNSEQACHAIRRGWRNTVGNLIETFWLKEACRGPQSTDIRCVKHGGVRFHRIRDFKQFHFDSVPPTSHILVSKPLDFRHLGQYVHVCVCVCLCLCVCVCV